jgi:NTP pyrophosphatase (non-canonical NTP hydrolase)
VFDTPNDLLVWDVGHQAYGHKILTERREIFHKYREIEKENENDKALADEMADVLWVLICLANQTGINLTEALEKNFEKKSSRDANRHQHNQKLKNPPQS